MSSSISGNQLPSIFRYPFSNIRGFLRILASGLIFKKPLYSPALLINPFAILAQSQNGKPICGRPTTAGRQRIQLFPAGVDTAKENIFQWLQVDQPGPGYVHFPNSVDEEYFLQLTPEKRAIKFVRGKKTVVWVPQRKRNEALDTFVYALVALNILQPNFEVIEASQDNTKGNEKQSVQGQQVKANRPLIRPKKSFVNSWK